MTFNFNKDIDNPKVQLLDGDTVVKESALKKGKNYTVYEIMQLFELKSCTQEVHELCFNIFKYNVKNSDHKLDFKKH